MTASQLFKGLASGAMFLTIGGAFWFSMAGVVSRLTSLIALGFLVGVPAVAILSVAILLRRKAATLRLGGDPSDDSGLTPETRKIIRDFWIVNGAQFFLMCLMSYLLSHFRHEEFIWPAIAVIVSLHFLPLAGAFSVKLYLMIGSIGTIISVSSFFVSNSDTRLVWLGLGELAWPNSACTRPPSERAVAGSAYCVGPCGTPS